MNGVSARLRAERTRWGTSRSPPPQEAEEVTRLILNEFRGSGLDEQNWGMKAQPWSGGWRVMPSYIGPPSQVMYVGPLELKLENGILRDVAEEGWEYKAP